eukprot:489054_1
MNFQQIDFSYISTMDTTSSICTDDDIEDLIEDVLKSIDEFEETNISTTTEHESSNNESESTITSISPSNSINYSKFSLFSPNPFYPHQPLPIPQQSASTSLSPTLKYLMHKLIEKDDNNDGLLDLQEFIEAIHEIDTDVDDDDIEHIFSVIGKGKYNEISINKFIEYIRSNSTKTSTPKKLFRGAFPDLFGSHCWGIPQANFVFSSYNDMELQQQRKEMEHELKMMMQSQHSSL